MKKKLNWFEKKILGLKETQSNWQLAIEELDENIGKKIYFKFDTGNKIIHLKKNHLEYYYKSDKDKLIFRNYYNDLREGMRMTPMKIKYGNREDSRQFLRISFGGKYTERIDIYKSKKDCKEFLEQLTIRYKDFVKRLVNLSSKNYKRNK